MEKEYFDNFIRQSFESMSEPNWGAFEEQQFVNKKTFQEICEEEYEGDLDEALDKFFRNELDMLFWLSEFYELENNDVELDNNFEIYVNSLSVEDFKNILGLYEYYIK